MSPKGNTYVRSEFNYIEHDHFFIFKETMIRDKDGKFVSEVEPYKLILN